MTEREWELLNKSIDEIKTDVKDVKKEMATLKIRVTAFSSFIGSIAGYFINKLFH